MYTVQFTDKLHQSPSTVHGVQCADRSVYVRIYVRKSPEIKFLEKNLEIKTKLKKSHISEVLTKTKCHWK